MDVRESVGARQCVVQHRPGQGLPIFIVDNAFPKRRTHSLNDAAVHLAFDYHRVNLHTAVVHSVVPLEINLARDRIHLYYSKVRPEREGEVGRVVERAGFQARFHALRHVPCHVGHEGDVLYRLVLVG